MKKEKMKTLEELLSEYGLQARDGIIQKEFEEQLSDIESKYKPMGVKASKWNQNVEKMFLLLESIGFVDVQNVNKFKDRFQTKDYETKVPDYFFETINFKVYANSYVSPLAFETKDSMNYRKWVVQHRKQPQSIWGQMFEEERLKAVFSPKESRKELKKKINQEKEKWFVELDNSIGMRELQQEIMHLLNIKHV